MKSVVRLFLLITVVLGFTACLSTEVELDIRDRDEMLLDLTYRMPLGLWEFGVFDEESPERAIPVSRRDAEETAVLYGDVTLVSYTLREEADRAVVHVVYRVESVAGLQGLWGRVSGAPLNLLLDSGRLDLPLSAAGPEDGIDPQQRDLILEVFDDEVFSVTIRTPQQITDVEHPELDGAEYTQSSDNRQMRWRVPMGALLASEKSTRIRLQWEEEPQ